MRSPRPSYWPLILAGLLVGYVALSGPLAGFAMKHPQFYDVHLDFYAPLLWLASELRGGRYLFDYWMFFGWLPAVD